MRWVRLAPSGDGPGPRSSLAACAVGGDVFVYGGEREPRVPVDAALFRLADGAWTKVRVASGGCVRCECWYVRVFGVWEASWVSVCCAPHKRRRQQLLIAAAVADRDCNAHPPPAAPYRQVADGAADGGGPGPRIAAGMAAVGSKVYLFGGRTGEQARRLGERRRGGGVEG